MDCPTLQTLLSGIKAVGVGKKGSKPIPQELVPDLIEIVRQSCSAEKASQNSDWTNDGQRIRQRLASFLGTLFVKSELRPTDEQLLAAVAAAADGVAPPPPAGDAADGRRVRAGCSSRQLLLAAAAAAAGSASLRGLALRLLDGHTLSREEARELGRRLFDPDEAVELQVLCAHLLRVRYETMDEWYGLLDAQAETLDTGRFGTPRGRDILAAAGKARLVQLAEPFDGTHRSESFAPLIARHLQQRWGAVVVSQCGPSSGPKYGPNLLQLALALSPDAPLAASNLDIAEAGADQPAFGWYVTQGDASEGLGRWGAIRRNVVKRPFLATAEKYLDTAGAGVLLASAFHPSFSDKMFLMAERASAFEACVIVRRGCEGSLGLSLARPAEFVCGRRRPDGTMERFDFAFGPADAGVRPRAEREQQLEGLSAKDTAGKIRRFAAAGASGDAIFDDRVALTLAGLDVAMEFVAAGRRLVAPADLAAAGEEAADEE